MVSFKLLAPLATMAALCTVQVTAADVSSLESPSESPSESTAKTEPTTKPQQEKCKNGEVHCLEKNQYKICEDGVWSAPKNLNKGQSCQDVDEGSSTNGAGAKSFGLAAAGAGAAVVALMQLF